MPLNYDVDCLYPVVDLCGSVRDVELVFPPYEVSWSAHHGSNHTKKLRELLPKLT